MNKTLYCTVTLVKVCHGGKFDGLENFTKLTDSNLCRLKYTAMIKLAQMFKTFRA